MSKPTKRAIGFVLACLSLVMLINGLSNLGVIWLHNRPKPIMEADPAGVARAMTWMFFGIGITSWFSIFFRRPRPTIIIDKRDGWWRAWIKDDKFTALRGFSAEAAIGRLIMAERKKLGLELIHDLSAVDQPSPSNEQQRANESE